MYLELMGVKHNLSRSIFDLEVDLDGALVAETAAELKVIQRDIVVHWLDPSTQYLVSIECCSFLIVYLLTHWEARLYLALPWC